MTNPENQIRRDQPPFKDILNWYGHDEWCANCTTQNHAYIRKGVRVKGLAIECDNCGCAIQLKP